MKRFAKIVLITVGALLICTVILGVINGLAGGMWTFGWLDYRYDGEYESGSGSVGGSDRETLKHIRLDWLEGSVLVVPCDDALISLTEESSMSLSEGDLLRWGYSEDGSVLSVKYRKSAWYFEGNRGEGKSLILRIPRRILEGLDSLEITTRGAQVRLEGLDTERISVFTQSGNVNGVGCEVDSLSLTSKKGSLAWDGAVENDAALSTEKGTVSLKDRSCPDRVDVKTENGKVSLTFGEQASFALDWITEDGSFVSDFSLTEGADGKLICGNGEATVKVETEKGELWLRKTDDTAD